MFLILSLLSIASSIGTASASETSYRHYNSLQKEELRALTRVGKFPEEKIPLIDPLSKEKMDGMYIGPSFKSKAGSGFDYYRYVTFYTIEEQKERIYSLPIHREDCHDKSEFFANNTLSMTYTSTINASVAWEGLGISATMTKAQLFQTGQNITATGDIVADNIPYMIKQSYYGRTFIETYSVKKKKVAFLLKEEEKPSWFMQLFFPTLTNSKYPMDFEVKDASWIFGVDRHIIRYCTAAAAAAAAKAEQAAATLPHPIMSL